MTSTQPPVASDAAATTTEQRSWTGRPAVARAIRGVVVLAPLSVGCGAAILANQTIAMPTTIAPALLRTLAIVVISSGVVWGVDRWARKLLPLAALMQLSLVFPDQAPSRFRSALKAGSSRRLERTLEDTRRNGLAKDPGDAARQVVELIGAIGDHDRRTRGHSERVRLFADLVGEELKLSKEERQKLQWGALLHDLGKLMVPSEILNKKGKPDADEWRILQGHPAAGMEMIEPLRGFLGEWVHAIGGHHEKWDGSGYPAGLRGSQIPRAAAIVAVADSFEVMTAVRSYKKAMPLAEARAELTRCAGTHFSPEVVRAFLNISLGHLRIVSGPLAALAHLPFLGNLAQLPGTAAAVAPAMVNAAAVPAAAMVTAAALVVGTPPKADAFEMVQTAQEAAPPGAVVPAAGPDTSAPGAIVSDDTTGATGGDDTTGATGGIVAVPNQSAGVSTTTTVAAGAVGGASAPATTTTVAPLAAPATTAAPAAAPASPTTTSSRRRGSSTTTTTRAPTTTRATTTTIRVTTTVAPTTTAPAPVTTAPAASTFTLKVATDSLRLSTGNLNGASFSRNSTIYVYAPISAAEITFTYPGGSKKQTGFPFDMMGTSLIAANGWQVPSTPGTYTITAVSKSSSSGSGSGTQSTASATFTVT